MVSITDNRQRYQNEIMMKIQFLHEASKECFLFFDASKMLITWKWGLCIFVLSLILSVMPCQWWILKNSLVVQSNERILGRNPRFRGPGLEFVESVVLHIM